MDKTAPQSILYDIDDQMMGDTIWHLWVLTAIRQAYPTSNIFVPVRWRRAMLGNGSRVSVPSHSDLIFPQKELFLKKISTGEPINLTNLNDPIETCLVQHIQNGMFDMIFSMHPRVSKAGQDADIPTFSRELGMQYVRPPETFDDLGPSDVIKQKLIDNWNHDLGSLKHIVFQIIDDLNQFLTRNDFLCVEYPKKIARPHARPYSGFPNEFWGVASDSGLKRASIISIQTGTSELEKIYPMDYFENLALLLVEAGYRVVFIGRYGTDPRPSDEFKRRLKEKFPEHVRHIIDEVGEMNFHQTKRIIAASQLHIAGDTGTAHLAAAMGKSVLALFGSFSQWQTAYPLKDEAEKALIRVAQQGYIINPYSMEAEHPKVYNPFLPDHAVKPNTKPETLLKTICDMGKPQELENPMRKKTNAYEPGIHSL